MSNTFLFEGKYQYAIIASGVNKGINDLNNQSISAERDGYGRTSPNMEQMCERICSPTELISRYKRNNAGGPIRAQAGRPSGRETGFSPTMTSARTPRQAEAGEFYRAEVR